MLSEDTVVILINAVVDAALVFGVVWFSMRRKWVATTLCLFVLFYQGASHGQAGTGEPVSTISGSIWLLWNLIAAAYCIGTIAGKLGKNQYLYGVLFLVPFINLIAIAVMAGNSKTSAVQSKE